MVSATKPKQRVFPKKIAWLRDQLARIPELVREKEQVILEIEERKAKVAEGLLTERALDGPKRKYDEISRTINMFQNEYPQQIKDSLDGELRAEYDLLKARVVACRRAVEPQGEVVEAIREELEFLRRREEAGSQYSSTSFKRLSYDEAASVRRKEAQTFMKERQSTELRLENALTMLRDIEQPLIAARAALDEFWNDLVWGAFNIAKAQESKA